MIAAIIVAAGQGARMRGSLRKQYLPLADLPVLAHTVAVLGSCEPIDCIYLVVPRDDFEFCRERILNRVQVTASVNLVAGGDRRQESVYQGVQRLEPDCGIVVIHDGVRPFVQPDRVVACIRGAQKFGACILGIPAYDTLKQVDESGSIVKTVDRNAIWMAQTPQAFKYELIKKAHDQACMDDYQGTDDASLVERLGAPVRIISGSRNNFKITTKEDLETARALLEKTPSLHKFL